ncbi:glycosyltransferase family 39 protein [Streptomyces lucensis]|nr:glycosyltransferase family 39 protein [Streptomyces lucensis]
MLAVGLWGLDRGGMWRDEAVTFQVGRRTVPQIWRLLHDVDAVHGLYYLLMRPVLAVHPGEVVLRLPSVCAAAVTAGLVAALGTRLARPRVGLWAGLLYAVTPMAGHYAQEGRSYALVAAGATGATLLFVRAARGTSWWAYGAVVALTCWLHEFAVLLLFAHGVSLALGRAGARVWRGWGRAAAAVVLSLLPMVFVSRAQAAQVAWLHRPTATAAQGLARQFLGPSDGVYWICLGLALLGLAGVVGPRGEFTRAGVALPLTVVPPAVLMLVSQHSPLYVDRYVLYALGGAPLLVAGGAERVAAALGGLRRYGGRVVVGRLRPGGRAALGGLRRYGARVVVGRLRPGGGLDGRARRAAGPWRSSPVALAGVLAVAASLLHQSSLLSADRDPGRRPDDIAAVSRLAARELGPGDPVLFLPAQTRGAALAYPRAFRGARDVALTEGAATSGTLYGREAGPAGLRRRLARLERVWVVADQDLLAGRWTSHSPTERAKLAVLRREYSVRAEAARHRTTVRLYVRRARATARPGPPSASPRPGRW